MYLIVIGWMYVVLMMSVAEATSSNGTVLGALVTFVLYGLGPVALVVYLMRAPARSKAIKKREAGERASHAARMAETAPPPGQEPVSNDATDTAAADKGAALSQKQP